MGGSSCRLKILINSNMIESVIDGVCCQIQEPGYEGDYDSELKMIDYLNEMEDMAFKFQRVFLESQGYKGPWPKAMN